MRLVFMWSLLITGSFAFGTVNANQNESQTFANASAEDWLAKMAQAVEQRNYRISFVVLKPGVDMQPYLWRHGVNEQGLSFEQVSRLNGSGREMLRVGNIVSYFEPNVPAYSLSSPHINGPLPSGLFAEPLTLSPAYEFIVVGRSRVSGKAAQHIRIVSRDISRYSVNLWIDQDSGLPLKLSTLDLKGQVIEQIQMTDVELLDDMPAYFANIERHKLPEVIPYQRVQGAGAEGLRLGFIPDGMTAIRQNRHRLALTGHVVDYMLLTDGLVDVSVYVQQAGQGNKEVLLRARSETFLSRSFNQFQITIIGKIPPKTANAIAESVSYGVPAS